MAQQLRQQGAAPPRRATADLAAPGRRAPRPACGMRMRRAAAGSNGTRPPDSSSGSGAASGSGGGSSSGGEGRTPRAPAPQQAQATLEAGGSEPWGLASELQLLSTWWPEARRTFPAVPWGPNDLVKVMGASLAAAALFGVLSAALLRAPPPPDAAAAADALGPALRHLAREGLLAALLPGAVMVALARFAPRRAGLLQARWEPAWVARTGALCALLFPLVDPLLYHAWAPLAEAAFGPAAPSALVAEVHAAAAAGDWRALGAHLLASGVVGPIWEEVFWRGFFLASLTKVLPLPACAAASALGFAALHQSPANFVPLLLLGGSCDALYLRTHNLLPPLLLHCLWNSSQLLAVALLGKPEFV
ncbi:MAG: hypothetical protein J3K34DRAFT_399633 [Monoraphidium minutum]|nr:MAG: hypothetical protein J3K34DRAFT_399633 [Monoraphidium minutum]